MPASQSDHYNVYMAITAKTKIFHNQPLPLLIF